MIESSDDETIFLYLTPIDTLDDGFYFSTDYGDSWNKFDYSYSGGGVITTIFSDSLNPRKFYAGTFGNGMFRYFVR